MATPILIVCPECNRQVKAPENVLGKKVRCKFCQAAFVAAPSPPPSPPSGGEGRVRGGPAAKPAKPAKPPAGKPAPAPPPPKAKKPAYEDDEDDDPNPYGMVDVNLSARCPHCANEMESEDAIVCLSCGYNTQTRELGKVRKVYGNTTGDQVKWLLPGIVCILVIIGVLIFNIWYLMKIDDLISPEDSWYLAVWTSGGIKLWVVIVSLFIIFFAGLFALKRLILHHAPPEVEKLK